MSWKRTLVIAAMLMAAACGTQSKLGQIKRGKASATISMGKEDEEKRYVLKQHRDTVVVKGPDGTQLILMKAVKDAGSGEMVATETLDAAVVTSRFRNVAEREGKITLGFDIRVPRQMQDSKWQLRFYPDMYLQGDSIRLEPLVITGSAYRKSQLRGYQQYQRFLQSIITDTTKLVDIRKLEIFLERNIPQLYRFKQDSSVVSDELFLSYYGVSEKQAVEHYTNMFAKRLNDRRKARAGRMYSKYVKVPIVTEGIRLDTVIRGSGGVFVYRYTQTLRSRPGLKRVDIVLSGDIYESDRKLMTIPRTEPLSFYVSSLSAFVDGSEHYLTRVVERRASANTACYVDFGQGSRSINPDLGHNRSEIGRIKGNIIELLENKSYDIDSIVIAASASPEGSVTFNNRLSAQRAATVAAFFEQFVNRYRDSLQRVLHERIPSIRFSSGSSGENWHMLSFLVDSDSTIGPKWKRSYMDIMEIADPDSREYALHGQPYYHYLRENLYPRLRTVRFDFFLHRKGMVRDTVKTTELDSLYMKGVQALRDMDYKMALELLKDYRDINTAIAFASLDYNASAMSVLLELEPSAKTKYLMAMIHSRTGDPEKALQLYLESCQEDPSLVFRGNLDPEIHSLKETYGLFQNE